MQLKLRTAIVLAVISGLLIPVSISTFLTLRQQQSALTVQFSEDHRRLTELLALGIQEPLWNLSTETGRPLFTSVLKDERVVSVTVSDDKAGVFLFREYPERRKKRQFIVQQKVMHGNQIPIGKVEIEMDTQRLDDEVAQYGVVLMLTVIGQLMLSLFLIILLLQIRVLSPIRRLMQQSEQLAQREHTTSFVWKRHDEIGSLGRSLESTRKALQELFTKLEERNRALKYDIKRRTRIEEELKRHRYHLEELVNQRTAILAQRSEELARSNAELEQLAYVASHDLQEPLRMISSYLQLLEKRYGNQIDADATTFITFAVDGAKRMQALINDLLSYSRIDTKGKPFLPVNCQEIMSDVLRMLRISIAESKAEIICDPLPTVMADATQVAQLLQNLLGNAIKFRGIDSPKIHIWAEPAGEFWQFHIKDNGIGIDPDYFERIFVMFQRLHTRTAYPGTGIGLSICKKIVERHGGRIWVESGQGKGVSFIFTLPRQKELHH